MVNNLHCLFFGYLCCRRHHHRLELAKDGKTSPVVADHHFIHDWLGDGVLIPMHYRFSGSYAAVSAIELQEIRELFPDGIYFTHELQYWLGP